MKKILLTFLALLLLYNNTFAEEECAIKGDMAPMLKEYMENTKKISKEITNLAREERKKDDSFKIHSIPGIGEAHSFILSTFSNVFNFESYYSYFKFWAIFPISNEIPYEIKRDYRRIENETEGLNRYLKTIAKNGLSDIEVNDICTKVSTHDCNLPNKSTAGKLIKLILKNHDAVMNMYRNVVIGETTQFTEPLYLIPADFETQLKEYYSPKAYLLCSKEEGGFFERIEESFNKVIDLQNGYKDGVQKWKDAIALLNGQDTSTQKYADLEKQLSLRELGKNGIHGDGQSNMLEALDKYNQEGLSQNSNFIYNSFNNTWNKLVAGLKELKENTIGDFFEKPEQKSKDHIDIEEALKAQTNSVTIIELKEKINKVYFELSRDSSASETNVNDLIARIIKSHIDILNSIEILSKSCQDAVDVCMKQDPSKGDCGKCN